LGGGRTPAHVIDIATGKRLYSAANDPVVPASTLKLLTAVSALDALGPDARLRTRVLLDDEGVAIPRVVIVGAGDPSLRSTPARIGSPGSTYRPASLRRLAAAAARALALRGVAKVAVRYDDSLFTGPAVHPSWADSFPAAGIVAPVSALIVDGGRSAPGAVGRVPDPARRAGQIFADQLAEAGVRVRGKVRAADAEARWPTLAGVDSPSVGVLVERMLAASDNDLAENLGRLGAAASGRPASFAGVSQRGSDLLEQLGLDRRGDRVADASGLSRRNQLRPATLTGLLQVGVEGYGALHSGLPVAGATGSLAERFGQPDQAAAQGVARAKTGTLTSVVGLAGYASRPDGRLLAFAFVDDSTSADAAGARAAVDRAVAALVSCRCGAQPGTGSSVEPAA
jgi:D-alanyl-D-alanine carboxypeptidase/D-alanyl-D-alanine-endopeptidase (penicillin-binding protein 4)